MEIQPEDNNYESEEETVEPAEPSEVQSQLGNVEYWDKFYSQEIKQFDNNTELIGEVWFGDKVQNKIVNYIRENHSDKNAKIVDLGSGNAAFLLKLANLGYNNLHGMDYSEKSIQLAQKIVQDKLDGKDLNRISLYHEDINSVLQSEYKVQQDNFAIIHDKGTFDAFMSSKQNSIDTYIKYIKQIRSTLNPITFILTSCNYSKSELETMFSQDKSEMKIVNNIPHQSFNFGGSSGQVVGDPVQTDEVIAEVETDKVNVEIKSEGAGVITNIFAGEQQKIDVGADFIEYDTEGKAEAAPKKEEPKVEKPAVQEHKPVHPTPATQTAQPSQPSQPTPEKKATPAPQEKKSAPTPSPTPVFTGSRNQRREPMNRIRQRIAERLKGSQNTYATLTTFNEVDVSEVMNIRNKFQDEFSKKYGVKLGFMSFFLRASAIALQEMPIVNSVIDGTDIIHREYIDISVAVATPTGLMVPVIRNCESKSLSDYELILRDLSVAARENKIKIEDITGGTFTVSNGGVYGSMLGTPIINPPQTAILGMHNIVNRAVVRGEEIVARPIMYLALSYDHKLIDGREGVLFLKKIKDLIEEPRKILLNL